jgi:RecA/RadA recombinase
MKRTGNSLSKQVKDKVENAPKTRVKKPELDGDITKMISTGSTLLDLAISGGRIRGGGIPAGILVEIFGPSSTGKTVLLTEIAGNIQNQKGEVMFQDPEARLNKQFAKLFNFELDEAEYSRPNLVPEVFQNVRNWEPKDPGVVNGIFADSLAALSTDMEMGSEEGDKMGARRGKEFSQ